MLSRGVVWLALIVTVILGSCLFDQDVTAGRLMTASSPIHGVPPGIADCARAHLTDDLRDVLDRFERIGRDSI